MTSPLRRHARALAPLFALVVAALPAHAEERELDSVSIQLDEPGELNGQSLIDADKLCSAFARALDATLAVDPQMHGVKLRIATPAKLTWGVARALLDFHDVVALERLIDGRLHLDVHLRRNLPQRLAPPFPVVRELPERNDVVTYVYTVKNGAGNDIFATVRGLLVRDVNRIGNVLYVRGPETIILVDLAPNVAYYKQVIEQLDVPAPTATRSVGLSNVPVEEAAVALNAFFGTKPGTVGGLRVTTAKATNRVVVEGNKADVDTAAAVLAELDAGGSALASPRLWKLATALAALAFLGQTLILRRIQRLRLKGL